MKRVSANICYTHTTEENKMLISFDFYDTYIGLNCESYYDIIQVHVDSNFWRRQREIDIWLN